MRKQILILALLPLLFCFLTPAISSAVTFTPSVDPNLDWHYGVNIDCDTCSSWGDWDGYQLDFGPNPDDDIFVEFWEGALNYDAASETFSLTSTHLVVPLSEGGEAVSGTPATFNVFVDPTSTLGWTTPEDDRNHTHATGSDHIDSAAFIGLSPADMSSSTFQVSFNDVHPSAPENQPVPEMPFGSSAVIAFGLFGGSLFLRRLQLTRP